MVNVNLSKCLYLLECLFKLQPVAKQGQIYVIEYKIHLSSPKCVLSDWSDTAVHYRVKSMTQKGGALINSF